MEYLRLKKVLKENGKSQKWLAEKMDKHITTINRWCNGEDVPGIPSLYEAAKHIDVSVNELLYDPLESLDEASKIERLSDKLFSELTPKPSTIQPSPNWEKMGIAPNNETQTAYEVEHIGYQLMLKYTTWRIEKNIEEMRELENPEEQIELLKIDSILKKKQTDISKILRSRIAEKY